MPALKTSLVHTATLPLSPTLQPSLSLPARQVSDAIPIPGLLDAMRPAVQVARTLSPSINGFAPPSPTSLLSAATSLMPPMLREVVDEGGRLSRAALALEQLASVAGEVKRGRHNHGGGVGSRADLVHSHHLQIWPHDTPIPSTGL